MFYLLHKEKMFDREKKKIKNSPKLFVLGFGEKVKEC